MRSSAVRVLEAVPELVHVRIGEADNALPCSRWNPVDDPGVVEVAVGNDRRPIRPTAVSTMLPSALSQAANIIGVILAQVLGDRLLEFDDAGPCARQVRQAHGGDAEAESRPSPRCPVLPIDVRGGRRG